jgi:hypothetical protein
MKEVLEMAKSLYKDRIKGIDLLINSSDKMSTHIPAVRTGCGAHKSIKKYTRKEKHKGLYHD